MKILIVNPILYTAETDDIPKVSSVKDTMIYALCMGFLQNGDEPALIAAENYKPIEKEEYPFPIIWLSCKAQKIFKPRCIPMLKGLGRYVKEHKKEYDYIISSEVFSLHTLGCALHGREKLIIWHELGAHNHMLKKLPSQFWYNVIARLLMRNIVIVPRSDKAADFIGKYCKNVLPIRIEHGVALDKIGCSEEKENYFVVLSQLIERKHINKIIEQFAAFRKDEREEYELKIIGDGVLRKELEEQVKAIHEEGYIHFLGKMNHEVLMPVLTKAKALLIYTSKDNSMVSITESIATGTPIVTTPVPFNSSYIEREMLGIVKQNWGVAELNEVCEKNEYYVNNCIQYREKLSNQYFAKQFNQIGETL